jgi:transposase
MPNFKPFNHDQSIFLAINFQEQLQPGSFEHTLHILLNGQLDLSLFYERYTNDTGKGGRAAYDPALLLRIVLFAYSKGITSSREIAWCCQTNITFKALSCDATPHWTTIAAFVSGYDKAIEALFEEVLLICDQQGLLGKELFAIDGCKRPSNAAKEWSGTHQELGAKRDKIQRQIRYWIKEHQAMDQSGVDTRKARTEQTLATLEQAHTKIDQFLKTADPRKGQGKRPKEVKSNITDNESAKMTTSKGTIQGYNGVATVDKKHQIIVDAQAFGEGQEHHTLQPVLEAVSDRFKRLKIATDIYASGAVVTADTGFANEANMRYLHQQGINAYIPDNQFRSRDPKFQHQKETYGKRHQKLRAAQKPTMIPASDFAFDPVNLTCDCPTGNRLSLRSVRETDTGLPKAFFEGKLLHCRHCTIKQQCMKNPSAADHRKGNGRQVSFVLSDKRKPTYTDWMKHRVDSPYGKQVYSHRMSVVEPVFGNIGTNKKLNRFSLRGKTKVQAQWRLFCLVHNIEKLANYGQLAV